MIRDPEITVSHQDRLLSSHSWISNLIKDLLNMMKLPFEQLSVIPNDLSVITKVYLFPSRSHMLLNDLMILTNDMARGNGLKLH